MSKLERLSGETAKAWKWVQANQAGFEKEVFAPPLISCTIKDQRYANAIESGINKDTFKAISTQTAADYRKLADQVQGKMGLADVALRNIAGEGLADKGPPPTSQENLRRLGFDGWAIDFIEGPEPVLAMLCDNARINSTAISLKEFTDEQHTRITQDGALSNWVAGKFSYKIIRRREYGAGATSTNTDTVRPAQHWAEQPVDPAAKREIEAKISVLAREFVALREEVDPVRKEKQRLRDEQTAFKAAAVSSICFVHDHY